MDARTSNFAVQEHALKQQAMEINVALKELEGAQKAYRFVGGLIIEKEPAACRAELLKKRESVTERLASLERAHKR